MLNAMHRTVAVYPSLTLLLPMSCGYALTNVLAQLLDLSQNRFLLTWHAIPIWQDHSAGCQYAVKPALGCQAVSGASASLSVQCQVTCIWAWQKFL